MDFTRYMAVIAEIEIEGFKVQPLDAASRRITGKRRRRPRFMSYLVDEGAIALHDTIKGVRLGEVGTQRRFEVFVTQVEADAVSVEVRTPLRTPDAVALLYVPLETILLGLTRVWRTAYRT